MSVAPIELPPTTVLLPDMVSVSTGGVTDRGALWLTPFRLALILAFTVAETGVVVTVKEPVVW